jgi:hypothetical protein
VDECEIVTKGARGIDVWYEAVSHLTGTHNGYTVSGSGSQEQRGPD